MNSDQPLVIYLDEPEWDLANRDKLATLLAPARDRSTVIIDLSDVTFLDSTSLAQIVLLHRHRSAVEQLRPLYLVIAQRCVRRVFEITGFARIWPIHSTVAEALAAASQPAQ